MSAEFVKCPGWDDDHDDWQALDDGQRGRVFVQFDRVVFFVFRVYEVRKIRNFLTLWDRHSKLYEHEIRENRKNALPHW